jgi:excisionase family DNA binding protein
VAWAWFAQTYPGEAGPERADDVRRDLQSHLIPFFAGRAPTIEGLDQDDVLAYVAFMAGKRDGAPRSTTSILPVRDYTLAEIAQLTGWSASSVHRAYTKGEFPKARTEMAGSRRRILVPSSDVAAAGFARSKSMEVPYGYSRTFVRELLNTLRRILDYAVARKLATTNAALGVRASTPRPGTKSRIPKARKASEALLLAQVKDLVAEMPLEGQVVIWLQRLAGLRVGESFGTFLDDITEVEGRTILQVVRQGGQKFKRVDAEGNVVLVDYTEELKTPAARRAIPISSHLASFLRVFIEASRGPEPSDLHIPLLTALRPYDQQAFRKHFARARDAAGLGVEELGFHVTPKMLRQSLSSQIGYLPNIALIARSKYLGHEIPNNEGSAPVTNQSYSLTMPRIDELLGIADAIDEAIVAEVGTVVVPAPASSLLDSQHFRADEGRSRAFEVLDVNGYLAPDVEQGVEVVTREEAAELLGVSLRNVARFLSVGKLTAVYRNNRRGVPCRMVTLESVNARIAHEQSLWTRRSVMEELGLSENRLQDLLRQLNLAPLRFEGDRLQRFDDGMVVALRERLCELEVLRNRAITVDETAELLGVHRSTVHRLLKSSRLHLDTRVSEKFGSHFVTRESLEEFLSRRERSRRRACLPAPTGTVTLSEAQRLLGCSRQEALALASKGLSIHRLADESVHIEMVSLRTLIKTRATLGHRPRLDEG